MTIDRRSAFDRFHIVLVEPGESRNVGSVARAMKNLGFRHLHLVAPDGYDPERAKVTACWSESVLETLVIHETFEEALSGMEEVVGLALRKEKNASFVTLPEWTRDLPGRAIPRTALVFGPEDNGLRQEHLNHCRWIIRIPSQEECPAFNLAQSVLLVLYELTKAFPEGREPESLAPPGGLPTWNDFFQLDRLLDAVMTESGFVRPGTPEPVPGTLKNLFRRIPLQRHEMGVLLGLFGRLQRTLIRTTGNSSPPLPARNERPGEGVGG